MIRVLGLIRKTSTDNFRTKLSERNNISTNRNILELTKNVKKCAFQGKTAPRAV